MKPKSHEPFKIRERIVFFGFGMLLLFAFLFNDTWIGLSAYAVGVSLADAFLTYVLKMKSSKYAVKQELLAEQGISPKAFDIYCRIITKVRLVSVGTSGLIASILLIEHYPYFQTFSLIYIALTFSGVLYLRRFTKIKKPVLVSFYELSAEEKKKISEKSFHDQIMLDPKYKGFYGNIYTNRDLDRN